MITLKRKLLYLFLVLFSPLVSLAQIPTNDRNWLSTPVLSDDFPSTDIFNGTNWNYIGAGCNSSYWQYNSNNNTILTTVGGTSVVQLNAIQNASGVSVGGIISSSLYTYGYFAARMELPSYGASYDDGFWLLGNTNTCCKNNNPPCAVQNAGPYYYYEIDCEVLPCTTANPTSTVTTAVYNYGTNVHYLDPTNICSATEILEPADNIPYPGSPNYLATSFHIYSYEWTRDHIIWYFDNLPIRMVHNTTATPVPSTPMNIWIDQNFQGITSFSQLTSTNTFPGYMDIDYVDVYNLNYNNCASLSFNSGTFSTTSTFNQIYYNITILSNSANTTTLSNTTAVVMRASNNTTIYGPFTVPAPTGTNAAFVILPTACN